MKNCLISFKGLKVIVEAWRIFLCEEKVSFILLKSCFLNFPNLTVLSIEVALKEPIRDGPPSFRSVIRHIFRYVVKILQIVFKNVC